jgi:hypothetical protein
MQESLALDAEALLVRSLTELAVEQEAALLVNSHVSGAGVQGMTSDGPSADVWELGLPPAMVLAPTLKTGKGPKAIVKQLPVLTSAGAAVAALPSVVRGTLAELAECHQVPLAHAPLLAEKKGTLSINGAGEESARSLCLGVLQIQGAVALRELRFLVLQAAVAELQVLRAEEGTRFHAYVPKPPRDSKFGGVKVRAPLGCGVEPRLVLGWWCFMRVTASQDDERPEFSWLAPSIAADSPLVFASAVREANLGGLDAVKVALQREQVHGARRLLSQSDLWSNAFRRAAMLLLLLLAFHADADDVSDNDDDDDNDDNQDDDDYDYENDDDNDDDDDDVEQCFCFSYWLSCW